MNQKTFDAFCEEQIDHCLAILNDKAEEYATDADRLHNFKTAAELQGVSPKQALAGMMAKHIVSIYDLCHDEGYTYVKYPDLWIEKITDSINYLLLLHEEEDVHRPIVSKWSIGGIGEDLCVPENVPVNHTTAC